MMEAVSTSETPVNFYVVIQHNIPQHSNLNKESCLLPVLNYRIHFSFPVALLFLENRGLFFLRFLNRVFRRLVGFLERDISPWQGLYLHRTTQHRRGHTSMPYAGFEPTIPDRGAPVIVFVCPLFTQNWKRFVLQVLK
jgi:hypothetical protein